MRPTPALPAYAGVFKINIAGHYSLACCTGSGNEHQPFPFFPAKRTAIFLLYRISKYKSYFLFSI
jgi:hypothetical protein